MNSGDKIIARINSDCDEAIEKINSDAQEKRAQIIREAHASANKVKLEVEGQALKKLSQMDASAKSRSELEIRNTLLKKRREEIDKTVSAVRDRLINLGDGEYFELIYKLAESLPDSDGEILLNERDLARKPADFESRLSGCGLNVSVSQTPVDIDGGFVLKKGNIEENLGISALIASNRDKLEDYINRELFAQ